MTVPCTVLQTNPALVTPATSPSAGISQDHRNVWKCRRSATAATMVAAAPVMAEASRLPSPHPASSRYGYQEIPQTEAPTRMYSADVHCDASWVAACAGDAIDVM
ncbi:hypothetical protein PEE19_11475 [Ralstonia solanacearum]